MRKTMPNLSLTEASTTIADGKITGPFAVIEGGHRYGVFFDMATLELLFETADIVSDADFMKQLNESIRQADAGELIDQEELEQKYG